MKLKVILELLERLGRVLPNEKSDTWTVTFCSDGSGELFQPGCDVPLTDFSCPQELSYICRRLLEQRPFTTSMLINNTISAKDEFRGSIQQ